MSASPLAAAHPEEEKTEGSSQAPSRHRFAQAAFLITGITIFSRLLGLVREALIASSFGVGPQTDAFFVAFKVPDIIFNSLMSFFVATCFVPIFTETLASEGNLSASRLVVSVLGSMTVLLTLLSLLMIALAGPIIHLLAPGLPVTTFALTVRLMCIMTPIIVFGGLTGLGRSVLNTFQRYLVPAFVPVVYNVVMIAFILILGRKIGVEAMGWGLVVSAVLQCLILVPDFRRTPLSWISPRYWISVTAQYLDENRRIAKLALPVLLAMLLGNVNAFIETYLASNLIPGSISYLSYAYRIFTVPEQIFTIVVSTIVFPLFSADVAQKNWPSLQSKALRVLSLTAFAVLPASVLIISASREIVGVMLGHGAFSPASVRNTSGALASFTLGLFSVCARSLVTFVFFALQDTRFLLKLTAFMVPFQLAIDLLLIPFFSFNALALGNSIAATLQVAFLLLTFRKRIGGAWLPNLLLRFGRSLIASAAMFGAIWVFSRSFIHWQTLPASPAEFGILAAWLLTAAGTYLMASWLLRIEETQLLWRLLLSKLGLVRSQSVLG